MSSRDSTARPHGFGTFQGVFTPSILTIIGVVMYLRFGWVLGNLGLGATLLLVTASSAITFLTGLSVSALATNREVGGGGAYYMVSRAFGAEVGAAVGIPLYLSQAIAIAFYVAGFTEAFLGSVPAAANWDPRLVGTVVLLSLAALSLFSANLALKAQYVIMAAIVASLVSFFLGTAPAPDVLGNPLSTVAKKDFWTVLAVFFPAVTGILSGVGMSGDLADPGRAIPRGTLGAVLTGWVIYMAVPIAFQHFAGGSAALIEDPMLFAKCARWAGAVTVGVWAACLSSALGSLLAAPRVVQAVARDRLLPEAFGRGYGPSDEPRLATTFTLLLATACIWAGGVDLLAPVLTMINLIVYALLNLSAGFEELVGSPSWRPRFRVPAPLSLLGFAGCTTVMLLISASATIVAVAVVATLHWILMRRRLNARWGDIRRGFRLWTVQRSLRALADSADDGRNWQPDLLVLAGTPSRRPRLVRLAGDIARDHGLVTVAAVIPAENWTAARADSMRQAIRAYLDREGLHAFAYVHPGGTPSPWTGMREMVRTYGFGPVAPNTILLGFTSDPAAQPELAALVQLAAQMRRNVVLVAGAGAGDEEDNVPSPPAAATPAEPATSTAPPPLAPPPRPFRIDLWWRGKGPNAPFLLALAWLVQHARRHEATCLRLCHVLEPGESSSAVAATLRAFLAQIRVDGEVNPVAPAGRPPMQAIRDESADAFLVIMGLRAPLPDETPAAYGAYLDACRASATGLPLTAFALAAESLDFRGIFA
ncbi:MAG: amino acid permease [Kiritimatiellae bacterium]|nr:amino acid permease [Kiritimatiellia bacterium]